VIRVNDILYRLGLTALALGVLAIGLVPLIATAFFAT